MERKETNHIPVWQRYLLTVTEAAEYYHIGETKLRMIIEEHIDGEFVLKMCIRDRSWIHQRKQ